MWTKSKKNKGSFGRILIVNYAMDTNHPIFSHQYDVSLALSKYYKHTTVLTNQKGNASVTHNLDLKVIPWNSKNRLLSIFNFSLFFLIELLIKRPSIVFYHMTEVQCAFTSPITKFLGIKSYLWYAHASDSNFLNFSMYFIEGLITSTKGSCPRTGDKVHYIGQGIDSKIFKFKFHSFNKPLKLCHVGRIDPSKNIEKIIDLSNEITNFGYQNSIYLVGAPSNDSTKESYIESLKFHAAEKNVQLIFLGNKPRIQLSDFLHQMDFFTHAYTGSLDKTLIEATMCGLPVLTLNMEYHEIFPDIDENINRNLFYQFLKFNNLDQDQLFKLLQSRYLRVQNHHSLDHWIVQLIEIFKEN